MKILIDMNLTPMWVSFLTENGIEAAHWSSIGSPEDSDTDIIAYAKKNDFVVFTNDLDFGYILAITHGKKPSVILPLFPCFVLNLPYDLYTNFRNPGRSPYSP
jgi:predicted nuclease of predicted toxin-antitoxin system